jgi:hypothetical protein
MVHTPPLAGPRIQNLYRGVVTQPDAVPVMVTVVPAFDGEGGATDAVTPEHV